MDGNPEALLPLNVRETPLLTGLQMELTRFREQLPSAKTEDQEEDVAEQASDTVDIQQALLRALTQQDLLPLLPQKWFLHVLQ